MSYSDNGMDMVVAKMFGDFVGHACDVGANDGLCNSNSLHLEEHGWTVLCIEPNPLLASAGKLRRKLWREVACSGSDVEVETFFAYKAHPTFASWSSISARDEQASGVERDTFKIKTRRLDRLLEEAGFPKLDFLTVDVEGWEKEVMAGFTAERWKPKVIVLEAWDDSYTIQIPGYEMFERRQYDNLYLRRDA